MNYVPRTPGLAPASSLSSPLSSGPASAPSTCSFSYPIRAGGDPGVAAPGGAGGSLLYSRESAPPPTAPLILFSNIFPEMRLLDHMVDLFFNFLRNLYTVLHSCYTKLHSLKICHSGVWTKHLEHTIRSLYSDLVRSETILSSVHTCTSSFTS